MPAGRIVGCSRVIYAQQLAADAGTASVCLHWTRTSSDRPSLFIKCASNCSAGASEESKQVPSSLLATRPDFHALVE